MQFIKNKKAKPIIIVAFLMLLAIFITVLVKSSNSKLVSAGEFNKILQNSKVESIYIKDKYIFLESNKGDFKSAISGINRDKIFSKYPVKVYGKSSNYLIYVAVLLLLLILASLMLILKRYSAKDGQSVFESIKESGVNIAQSEIAPQYNSEISFKNVAGISEVKEDLEEIISFLKSPLKFKKLGIRMPKGVLLVGPPGVGKTLIAKAISAEANVPFFYHSGANFVHIYAGMGAKRVKELFNKAKEMAPSIIFIDEIDSVGKARGNLGSEEREATLNQLLVEMDGFDSASGVIVIGATNRLDVLDNALLRPGRFDRRIFIDLPNLNEREQVLNLYLKDKKHKLDTFYIAKLTAGFSPAELETLVNEAALNALKDGRETVELKDIDSVKERVIYGKKRVPILTDKEREIQSYYQASKAAVASWLGFKVDRAGLLISININKEASIYSKQTVLNEAKVLLAGSIYLKQKFEDYYNIGAQDRAKAKSLIKEANEKFSIMQEESNSSLLQDLILDLESTLNSLQSAIDAIAKKLYEQENLSYDEIKKELDALF